MPGPVDQEGMERSASWKSSLRDFSEMAQVDVVKFPSSLSSGLPQALPQRSSIVLVDHNIVSKSSGNWGKAAQWERARDMMDHVGNHHLLILDSQGLPVITERSLTLSWILNHQSQRVQSLHGMRMMSTHFSTTSASPNTRPTLKVNDFASLFSLRPLSSHLNRRA
jgi:hypothetical protein